MEKCKAFFATAKMRTIASNQLYFRVGVKVIDLDIKFDHLGDGRVHLSADCHGTGIVEKGLFRLSPNIGRRDCIEACHGRVQTSLF